jgi:hypothetical protein
VTRKPLPALGCRARYYNYNNNNNNNNIVFLRDVVCLRNICVNTQHKGDSDDDNNNKE